MKLQTYGYRTPGWAFGAAAWDGCGTYFLEFNFWKWEFGLQLWLGASSS